MRRIFVLAVAASTLAVGLAATQAPAARATPLPLALGGCMETPVPLSDTATITRTCGSWDGTNLALWVEGSGLAEEFTAVGTATFDLFGYILTIEARAGMRSAPFGGWEAFVELTRPFPLGPLTVPLQVADDGSRVTLWLSTAGLTARSTGLRTDAANSFSLAFAGPDGTPRGTVVVPMALSGVAPPPLPTPDLHPSTPGTTPPASSDERVPGPDTAGTVAAPASARPAAWVDAARTGVSLTRVGDVRAALGRY